MNAPRSRDAAVEQMARHLAKAILIAIEITAPPSQAPAAAPDRGHLLGTTEVAAMLGLSTRTLYNWQYRRPALGPEPVRVGGRLRWQRETVEAWIREQSDVVGRD